MMNDFYLCTTCREMVPEGNDCYYIKDDNNIGIPFCSVSCVEFYKEKEINRLEAKIEKIKNKIIKKDVW